MSEPTMVSIESTVSGYIGNHEQLSTFHNRLIQIARNKILSHSPDPDVAINQGVKITITVEATNDKEKTDA